MNQFNTNLIIALSIPKLLLAECYDLKFQSSMFIIYEKFSYSNNISIVLYYVGFDRTF